VALSADRIQSLADLTFEGGYPSDDAAQALGEELFFQRAVQTYLWALPAVNMCAMKRLGEVAASRNCVDSGHGCRARIR
jgi:hypothetical protein